MGVKSPNRSVSFPHASLVRVEEGSYVIYGYADISEKSVDFDTLVANGIGEYI
jgi:hypothetical protein